MLNNINTYRTLSTLEAISFLVLLFVAVPIKYIVDAPLAVRIIGPIHGGLFILYVIQSFFIKEKLNWSYKVLLLAVLCSVLPFGPFYIEKRYLPKKNA